MRAINGIKDGSPFFHILLYCTSLIRHVHLLEYINMKTPKPLSLKASFHIQSNLLFFFFLHSILHGPCQKLLHKKNDSSEMKIIFRGWTTFLVLDITRDSMYFKQKKFIYSTLTAKVLTLDCTLKRIKLIWNQSMYIQKQIRGT